jgi:TonB family protein
LGSTNPAQSNQQPPSNTPNNSESDPELVPGLKPEVWAYQQALRQELLARQAAATQGEPQTQNKVTPQEPAQAVPQQTTTGTDSQSQSEVTETPEKESEVVETPSPEGLTHHQQEILAYQQQLREENSQREQGGSLSEEEEAMLAGGEEFYTWFMQLRQELPNLAPKTPSSIADNYPLAACAERLEGRAVVGTVVNPNGEIMESPKVLRGTGSEILDDAALNYVESVGFPANDQPTAYQYSFEFNYNGEICSIAAPDGSSENQTSTPEGETAIGETEASGLDGDSSHPKIEAINTSPLNQPPGTPVEGTDESQTEALQPGGQSSDPLSQTSPDSQTEALQPGGQSSDPSSQTSPESRQDGEQQPSNPLTLEPEPENSNGYKIYTPVPLPTDEER